MADPELVLPFLRPRHSGLGSKDLDGEAVLPAGRYLAYCERASRAISHAEHDCGEVLGIDRRLDVILGSKFFPGEGLDRSFRLLAGLVEGLQVRAHARDAQAGDVFGDIAPVRADIGETARRP